MKQGAHFSRFERQGPTHRRVILTVFCKFGSFYLRLTIDNNVIELYLFIKRYEVIARASGRERLRPLYRVANFDMV